MLAPVATAAGTAADAVAVEAAAGVVVVEGVGHAVLVGAAGAVEAAGVKLIHRCEMPSPYAKTLTERMFISVSM